MSEPRVLTEAEQRFIDLGNKLWNDTSPRGKEYRAAAKEAYPDAVTIEDQFDPIITPFRDEVAKLTQTLKERDEQMAAEAKERAEKAAEDALRGNIEAAVSKFNLTEAGRELTIKRMQDTGNFSDPMAAAAWVVHDNPPPKDPSGYLGPQAINLFGSGQELAEERVKLLHKDPMGKFLDSEFTDFIRDPDQYVRDAGFAA